MRILMVALSVLVLSVLPGRAEDTPPWLGFNLAPVSDWSTQLPFLDLMKSARPWIGHLPGQWGGWDHDELAARGYLDADGWPLRIPADLAGISTMILTDLPADADTAAGHYLLTHDGDGVLEIGGRAENVRRGRGTLRGRAWFDATPGEGGVILTIRRSNPDNPLRNIRIVAEQHAADFEGGEVFNPVWLDRLSGSAALRFIDWGATNNSTLSDWGDRPRLGDYTWARNGVPLEVMVTLANRLRADPWFTLPHLADDDFIRAYAEQVRDGLDPGLRAWVELSNEVWNWQFTQAHWAEAEGRARWGRDNMWMQYYAKRAAQMVMIWDDVFADAPERLVRVLATQSGWIGLEQELLAPMWVAEDPSANPAPPAVFDAYAVTGYFTGDLGGAAKVDLVREWIVESRTAERDGPAHPLDAAVTLAARDLRDGSVSGDARDTLAYLIDTVLEHHARVAADWGLQLVAYEGGTHVVGLGAALNDETLTEFFTYLNYTPEMGALYDQLLKGWRGAGGGVFMHYYDIGPPGRFGSWGALRHLGDDNPRWRALRQVMPGTGR